MTCPGNSINDVRWRKFTLAPFDFTRGQERGARISELLLEYLCIHSVPDYLLLYHGPFVRCLGGQMRRRGGLLDLQFAQNENVRKTHKIHLH